MRITPWRTRGITRSPMRGSRIGVSRAVAEVALARTSAAEKAMRTSGRRKKLNVAEKSEIVDSRLVGAFDGKRGLVLGVANKRSIAWAIASRLAEGGAELAFTFQGERIEKSVRELAESVGSRLVTECDVRSDEDLARVFDEVGQTFDGGLDILVHSVAFAAAEDLEARFTDTPRDRFWLALDVSAYSLVACSRLAEPLMDARGGGAIPTMTDLGGERAGAHYNGIGGGQAAVGASVRYLAWGLRPENNPVKRG